MSRNTDLHKLSMHVACVLRGDSRYDNEEDTFAANLINSQVSKEEDQNYLFLSKNTWDRMAKALHDKYHEDGGGTIAVPEGALLADVEGWSTRFNKDYQKSAFITSSNEVHTPGVRRFNPLTKNWGLPFTEGILSREELSRWEQENGKLSREEDELEYRPSKSWATRLRKIASNNNLDLNQISYDNFPEEKVSFEEWIEFAIDPDKYPAYVKEKRIAKRKQERKEYEDLNLQPFDKVLAEVRSHDKGFTEAQDAFLSELESYTSYEDIEVNAEKLHELFSRLDSYEGDIHFLTVNYVQTSDGRLQSTLSYNLSSSGTWLVDSYLLNVEAILDGKTIRSEPSDIELTEEKKEMEKLSSNLVEAVEQIQKWDDIKSEAQSAFLADMESLIKVVNMKDIKYNIPTFERIYHNLNIYKGKVPDMTLEYIPKTHRDLKKKLADYLDEVSEFIEIEYLKNREEADDSMEVLLEVLKDFVRLEKIAIFEGEHVDHEQDLIDLIDSIPGLIESDRNLLKEELKGRALEFFADTLDADIETPKVYTGEEAKKMFREAFSGWESPSTGEEEETVKAKETRLKDVIKGLQDTEKDFENTFSISELRQSVGAPPTAPTTPEKEAKNEKATTSSMTGITSSSPLGSRFGNTATKGAPFLSRVSSAPVPEKKDPISIVPSKVKTNVTVDREQMVRMLNDMIDQKILDIQLPKYSSRKKAGTKYSMSVTGVQEDEDGNFAFLFEEKPSALADDARNYEAVDGDEEEVDSEDGEYEDADLEKLWQTDPDVSGCF